MLTISERLRDNGRQAGIIPFITAGYPYINSTVDILHALADAGADVIELGVPFSDPMADGEAIQRANEKALANGMSLVRTLQQVEEFRRNNTTVPVVLMGYTNSFINYQGDFAAAAATAGVNGLIIVDLAYSDYEDWRSRLTARQIDLISLVSPTTLPARMQQIAATAQGFLYFIALRGVTGAHHLHAADIAAQVQKIRQATKVPLAVGFGIRDAKQAAEVAQLADAVVIGSRLIEIAEENYDKAPAAIADFIRTIADTLR